MNLEKKIDLSAWRKVPMLLMLGGGALALIGLIVTASLHRIEQFAYSWLLAFMFFLSFGLGALFLVIVHHLFDAGWSVPIRRFCEHIATLLSPTMLVLFLPIAFLANRIYPWMHEEHPRLDHALQAKQPLFSSWGFYLAAAFCFLVWWLLTNRLRYWSLKQ